MKITLILFLLFTANIAQANSFEKTHYKAIQAIIWAADKVEVPRELLLALCWGESNFRTKGASHQDGGSLSHGMCQVKLNTALFMDAVYKHKVVATRERLEDPKVNAFYAAKFLKYQLKRYGYSWQLAVDAYNKGSAVSENSAYVKRFVKSYYTIASNIPNDNK